MKSFLRDLNLLVIKAQFTDSFSTLHPVKRLFLRFLIGTNVLGARGYFRDLFFDVSLTKYSQVPNFKKIYDQYNSTFQKILLPTKGSNRVGATFFVTKPLIRYDYSILLELCNELGIDDKVEFDFFFDSTNLEGMDMQIKEGLKRTGETDPKNQKQPTKKVQEETKNDQNNIIPKELKDPEVKRKTSEEPQKEQPKISTNPLAAGLGGFLSKKREAETSQTQEKKPEKNPEPKPEPKKEERPGSRGNESGSSAGGVIPKTIAGFQEKPKEETTSKPGNKKLAKHLNLDPSMDSGELEDNLQELGIQTITDQPATIVEDHKEHIMSNRSDQNKQGLFKGIKKDSPQAEPVREVVPEIIKNDPKPIQKQESKPIPQNKAESIQEIPTNVVKQSSNPITQKQSEPKKEISKSISQLDEPQRNKVESIAPEATNKNYHKSNTITAISKSRSESEQHEVKPEKKVVQVVKEQIIVPDPENFIDKETYFRKIKELEAQQEEEKASMINKINIIEEKYALVLDMVSTMAAEKNVERQSILDDARFTSYIGGNDESQLEKNVSPQKNMADDEFYVLNSEIERAREEAFKAEIEYIMYKKMNFFEGDEGKRITYKA